MDPRTYSQNANEIIPGLWLGNFESSRDNTFIMTNRITVVFNCTKDLPFSGHIPVQYRIPLDDNLEEDEIRNMGLWADEIAYKIVSHVLQGHRILVHCMAGMQRSAACVAISLIVLNQYHTMDAVQFIRSKRQIAFYPSANFIRSIQHFDEYFHKNIVTHIKRSPINV